MNHIQNFFPGPGAVGAGGCIRDTMLGNEFIGVILVGIQPQVGKIGVFIVGNHRHGLDILNSNAAGTVNHQIEVNDFADQIEVVRLSRDEISERVEDESLCAVIPCDIFHGLCNVGMGADDDICAPVDDLLCPFLDVIPYNVGIFVAPMTADDYNICNLFCLLNLLLNQVFLFGSRNFNIGIFRQGVTV